MRGKGSYFYRFFLNFIGLLLVPLITILVIFWQADRTVKSQVFESADKSLERYSDLFDVAIKDASQICLSIFSWEECVFYSSYSTVPTMEKHRYSYKINEKLKTVYESKYYDIFVYFHTDDKVISAYNSTVKSDYYYDIYYGGKGPVEYEAEFKELLVKAESRPTLYVMNSQSDSPFLCIAMNAQNLTNTENKYTICVVLEPKYIDELYSMGDLDENTAFLIFDREEKLLECSNPEMKPLCDNQDSVLSGKEVAVWNDEGDYMLQLRKSDVMSGYYAYIVSSESFWDVLSELRFFCAIGILCCFLVSVLYAYRNTVKLYQPIDELLGLLKAKGNVEYDKSKGNEFQLMSDFLYDNERKLKENRRIQREWILHKLLRGDFNRQEEEIIYKDMNLFQASSFGVCILQMNSCPDEKDDLNSFIIQNVFEELCNEANIGYVIVLGRDRYAILLNLLGEPEELKERLSFGQEFLKQHFGFVLTLVYSDIHEGIDTISLCYKEALETIRYQFLLGNGGQITYRQIAERKVRQQTDLKSGMVIALLQFVRNEGKERDTIQFVESLLKADNIHSEASMDRVDLFRLKILDALNKVISMCVAHNEALEDKLEELINQPTLEEFQTCLCDLLDEIKGIEESKSADDIIVRAKEYIEQNYWNSELSVTMLGKEMGLQGRYLSTLFKNKYQISMLDYISHVRIAAAKKLLLESNLTIQKIAGKTGFLSDHVFIRAFKKIEGITPGRYKELANDAETDKTQ